MDLLVQIACFSVRLVSNDCCDGDVCIRVYYIHIHPGPVDTVRLRLAGENELRRFYAA